MTMQKDDTRRAFNDYIGSLAFMPDEPKSTANDKKGATCQIGSAHQVGNLHVHALY